MNKIESTFDDGYDSEGQIGPFNYVEILEGQQDFDEDSVSESTYLLQDPNILEPTNDVDTQNVEESSSVPILDETTDISANEIEKEAKHVPISPEKIQKMKNPELKEKLRLRGQITSGKKKLLIERLQTTLEK